MLPIRLRKLICSNVRVNANKFNVSFYFFNYDIYLMLSYRFMQVHIVLPRHMSLDEAHDIGESLQLNIENMDGVERAFVHLDYECIHDPITEHKPIIGSRKRTHSSKQGAREYLYKDKC